MRFSKSPLASTSALAILAAVAGFACSSTVTGNGTGTDAGTPSDAATTSDAATKPDTGTSCTTAKNQLLVPIAKSSTATVKIISDTNGTKTLFVDASVGGPQGVSTLPRVYLDLSKGTRVDIDDNAAETSTDWDLSLKRPVIFTNGGEGGSGSGKAGYVDKDFDAVTAADEASAKMGAEDFLDNDCNPVLDRIGNPATTFADWYDYNEQTHVLTPFKHVYLVRGGTGKLYKVQIMSFYTNPDGSIATEGGGRFLLKVAAL
ncbi:MAG: HmuY family protein [Polyangiaceae bacterium]